jgi:putative phage-type endonuclease
MQIHELVQGTPAWHAYRATHFNASDAPAMLGLSPYKTRSTLLQEMFTGMAKEVDAATQRRFDDGHRFEALARPIAEEIVGEDLYPVIGSEGKLSASFDGLTMDESICFEHKTLNDDIRSAATVDDLGAHLHVQMEQQLMISGAEKCLFLASKWDEQGDLIEEKHFWYVSNQSIRTAIVQGWAQFAVDLANFQMPEVEQVVVATPKIGLPALSIQVDGSISLISNLDRFGTMLTQFVSEIDKEPTDDQGFADAELAIKTLEKAESALEAAESNALAQTASVDDMRKTVALYMETARTTRLMLQKMVKARKESIRIEIALSGTSSFESHFASLNKRLGRSYMPRVEIDCAGAMKGKKTISSLRDAVATELARAKIEANAIADKIEINLGSLRELAADHVFLFSDTDKIVMKDNDDLVILINSRINEHKAAEAAKLEAERARIQQEEAAKAKAAQDKINADATAAKAAEDAKAAAEIKAAQDKIAAEAEAQKVAAEKLAADQRAFEQKQAAAIEPVAPAKVIYPALTAELAGATVAAAPAVAKVAQPTRDQIIFAVAMHFKTDARTAADWISNTFAAVLNAA